MTVRAQARRLVVLVLSVAAFFGCDKLYCAKITAALPKNLPEPRYLIANQLLDLLSNDLGLKCKPDRFIEVPSPGYMIQTTNCFRLHDNNSVQAAFDGTDVSLKIERLGGFSEPTDFHSLRTALASEMRKAVGSNDVRVAYPCRR